MSFSSPSLTITGAHGTTISGVVDQTFSIGSAASLLKTGTGTLTLTANNDYTGGTTVTGGLVNFNSADNFGPSGSGTITLDGGGLQWATGTTTDISDRLASIGAGGAVFDTNGNEVSFATGLSGSGGITKQGAGTLVLLNDSSYAGPTVINAGRLRIDGSGDLPSTTQVTVALGATLEVTVPTSIGTLAGDGNVLLTGASSLLSTGLSGAATTFSGAITGDGWFVVENNGSLTLTSLGNSIGGNLLVCCDLLDIHGGAFTVGGTTAVTAGTMRISAGGSLATADLLVDAEMTIEGASQVTVSGSTTIEATGANALRVSGGSTLDSQGAIIASSLGGTAHAIVTGAGSTWDLNGGMAIGIGSASPADLTISEGGVVRSAGDVSIFPGSTLYLGTGGLSGTISAQSIINDGQIIANFTGSLDLSVPVDGAGSLTKRGGGVLSLSGNNLVFGSVAVNDGLLRVEGSIDASTVTVGAGAVLGGSGSIAGAVTVANGGFLAPGSSPGTLTVGSLTLNPTSQLDYQLGTPGIVGGGVNDLVQVTGALALDGVLNIDPQAGFSTGTYTLFTAGTIASNGGLVFGAVPAGYEFVVDTGTPGQVKLLTTYNGLQFWNGSATTPTGALNGGPGTWDATTTNWTNQAGNAASAWANLTAVFGGPAGGTVTLASDQQVAGLQFTTGGYTLTGPGALVVTNPATEARISPSLTATIAASITGSGGLVKTGAGTIVLSGSNTYAGGTTINGGTLSISSDANLGATSGGLAFNGGTLATTSSFTTNRGVTLAGAGAFNVAGGTTLTIGGTITGAGALGQAGPGTLILTGANTYAGGTTINGGTLSISSDANLGATSGGLAFDGGTLGTTASFTTNRGVTLAGTGAFNVAGGTTLTIGGTITGAGALEQAGAGTLILAGANTYAGGTTINGGTLSISSDANLGATSGGLAFNGGTLGTTGSFTTNRGVTLAGAGAFNVAGGTTLTVGGTITGAGALGQAGLGTLILTGANTYAGGTTVSSGTLVLGTSTAAGTGAISLSGGTTLGFVDGINVANAIRPGGDVTFDLASGSATASGPLSGSGAIAYTGAGLITLTGDSSAFAGTTAVSGALSVNGILGGSVNVLSGGTLKGNGAVGPTTVAAGGAIAPGNSIGMLTVNGPLTFASGSTYAVEINPQGQSDLITVTGRATLGGATVSVTKAPGNYLPGTQFTILTAQGGVAGTFGPLIQDMPFVNLALSYDPNDVYLTVARNQTSFPHVAVTSNQIATASAVEALGQGTALYNAVVTQTSVAGAQQAFNALSGEIYPSAMSALQDESLILRRAVLDRARVPVQAPSGAPLAYAAKASSGADVVAVPGTPNAFWAQGFGAWGRIDGNGNAATLSGDVSGIIVGYDRTVSGSLGDWRLGFAAGYSSSSYQVDARSSSFSSDNAHVALYGGTTLGPFGVRFGGAYSWADINADRSVVFPGFSNALTTDTSARTGQVFGEVGYGLSFAAVNVEPFAGLAYVNVNLGDVTEIGGPAALTGSGGSQGVTYSTLGARIRVPFALGAITTAFKGTLAWQHAFGDTTPEALFAFGPGARPFAVSGVPIAADAALIEAGLDLTVSPNASLSIFYAGQLAETDTNNMLKGSFTVRF